MVKIVVKLKNCQIGTKIGVIKYKKTKNKTKNTEPPHSRTRGPVAPAVQVQNNLTWIGHLENAEKAILPQIRKNLGLMKTLGRMLPTGSVGC